MLKRTVTGIGIVAVVYLFLWFSAVPFVMQLAVSLLTVGVVFELCKATKNDQSVGFVTAAVFLGAVFSLIPIRSYEDIICVAFPVIVVLFVWMMIRQDSLRFDRHIKGIMLIFAVLLLLKAIPEVGKVPCGKYYLTMAVTLCFATDIGAYLVGCGIGRHKLIPSVSPNKTVEGAVGGILVSVLGMLLGGWYLDVIGGFAVNKTALLTYAVLAAIVAEFGDLAMSCVKRIAGIKDFGDIFPGHGGLLDRFDSHLFVIAFTVVYCALSGGYL